MTTTDTAKVWLVTGAGTGLGKAVVEYVLSKGDKVCATLRKTHLLDGLVAKYPSSQLTVTGLDVTSTTEISAAFATAVKAFGRVDVVYNNAAGGTLGEVEGDNEEVSRKHFDVNFWGAVNVSKEAVRVFREVNKPAGGVLLQASSIAGLKAIPVMSFYSASKWALEGVSEALAQELDPSWNIRIKVLTIGGFDSGALEKINSLPLSPAYASLPDTSPVKATLGWVTSGLKVEGDPAKFARAVFDISKDDKLDTLRVPLGEDALKTFTEKIEEHKAVLEKASKYSDDLKYTK